MLTLKQPWLCCLVKDISKAALVHREEGRAKNGGRGPRKLRASTGRVCHSQGQGLLGSEDFKGVKPH